LNFTEKSFVYSVVFFAKSCIFVTKKYLDKAININVMKTTKSVNAASAYREPERLSKAGQWRRDNPGGIFVVVDRRAVNK